MGREIRFSLVNTEAGVVRAIDIYGGRNHDGEGRWRSWKELRKYYVRGLKSKAVQDRMSSDYNILIEIEKEEPGELTEWLHWFAPKQEGDGATKENARVELLYWRSTGRDTPVRNYWVLRWTG